jgi:hypothetical protein
MPDEPWLRAVAEFARLHASGEHGSARRAEADGRVAPVAVLLLVR